MNMPQYFMAIHNGFVLKFQGTSNPSLKVHSVSLCRAQILEEIGSIQSTNTRSTKHHFLQYIYSEGNICTKSEIMYFVVEMVEQSHSELPFES